MGRIGPRQQRYEVLPAESFDLADLLRTWRAQPAPSEDAAHAVPHAVPHRDHSSTPRNDG